MLASGDGSLRSGDTDGTCLDFLASATSACLMRTAQTARLCWSSIFSVIRLSAFATRPGRRGLLAWLLRGLLGLVRVDLEATLKAGVAERDVGMRGQHVRHGRRRGRRRRWRGR